MKNIKLIRNFSILTKVAYYFPEIFFIIKNIKNTLKKKGIEIMPSPVKMDPRIKALWVANLLTGTYTKTTNFLRKDNCYCVLGVLCDLHSKETQEVFWYTLKSGVYIYEDETLIAPYSVIEWAAMSRSLLRTRIVWDSDNNIYHGIMGLNDSTQKACSFEELGYIIHKAF